MQNHPPTQKKTPNHKKNLKINTEFAIYTSQKEWLHKLTLGEEQKRKNELKLALGQSDTALTVLARLLFSLLW